MRLFFSSMLGILLAGCSGGGSTLGAGASGAGGSGTGSSSSSAAPISGIAIVQAYCEATAGPFCEALFNCCPNPSALTDFGGTVENCKKLYSGARCLDVPRVVQAMAASIDSGATVFDQGVLDACVAHLKEMSAGGDACVEPSTIYYDMICITAFKGQLEPGQPCTIDDVRTLQCKGGYCLTDIYACRPYPQTGEVCGAAGCDRGQQEKCVPDLNPTICVHQGDIGDTCLPVDKWTCKSGNCDEATSKCVLPDPMSLCKR